MVIDDDFVVVVVVIIINNDCRAKSQNAANRNLTYSHD